jgi:hypothetical protein
MHSSMATRLSQESFSCIPDFRLLIIALSGFSFVVTLMSCVGRRRLIYEWACLYLRPIWLAYM